MNIGDLNMQIKLYQNQDADDGMGGRATELTEIATVWAQALRPRFHAAQEQGSSVTTITQGFKIRARQDIQKGWQVMHSGAMYHVLHVDNSNKAESVLTCTEVEL